MNASRQLVKAIEGKMKTEISEPRACQAPMMRIHHSQSQSGKAPVPYPELLIQTPYEGSVYTIAWRDNGSVIF
jgi:hypothetical protein